jgi:hypothetical protein
MGVLLGHFPTPVRHKPAGWIEPVILGQLWEFVGLQARTIDLISPLKMGVNPWETLVKNAI